MKKCISGEPVNKVAYCSCNNCKDYRQERRTIATTLAGQLRALADACLKAAEGDDAAKGLLKAQTDGYWHGLVVGAGKVQILSAEEEDDDDSGT